LVSLSLAGVIIAKFDRKIQKNLKFISSKGDQKSSGKVIFMNSFTVSVYRPEKQEVRQTEYESFLRCQFGTSKQGRWSGQVEVAYMSEPNSLLIVL